MKTPIGVVCIFLVACVAGAAATISEECPSGSFPSVAWGTGAPNAIGATVTFTCLSLATLLGAPIPASWTLNAVTVTDRASFDIGTTPGTNSIIVTASFGPPAATYTWSSGTLNTASESGVGFGGVSTDQSAFATGNLTLANAALPFTVTATAAVTAGGVNQIRDVKTVTYDYSTSANTQTPEPEVLSMVAVGLAGLALFRRRLQN